MRALNLDLGFSALVCVQMYTLLLLGFYTFSFLSLGLPGILFPNQCDVAYSAQRIWLGVGFAVGFIITEFLHITHVTWLMLAAALVALLCAIILEIKTQSKATLLPCCCYCSARKSYNLSDKVKAENSKDVAVNGGPATRVHIEVICSANNSEQSSDTVTV